MNIIAELSGQIFHLYVDNIYPEYATSKSLLDKRKLCVGSVGWGLCACMCVQIF